MRCPECGKSTTAGEQIMSITYKDQRDRAREEARTLKTVNKHNIQQVIRYADQRDRAIALLKEHQWMMSDEHKVYGEFILWVNYAYEGWHPKSTGDLDSLMREAASSNWVGECVITPGAVWPPQDPDA